jgi:hypothetical protein
MCMCACDGVVFRINDVVVNKTLLTWRPARADLDWGDFLFFPLPNFPPLPFPPLPVYKMLQFYKNLERNFG